MKLQELVKEYAELSMDINQNRLMYGKDYEATLGYAMSTVRLQLLECKIAILKELFKTRSN